MEHSCVITCGSHLVLLLARIASERYVPAIAPTNIARYSPTVMFPTMVIFKTRAMSIAQTSNLSFERTCAKSRAGRSTPR